jgi:hypothetical protein
VRVTAQKHVPGYRGGEKGTVLRGPTIAVPTGQTSYVVRMDGDTPEGWNIFFADEIEPDG